MNDQTEHNTRHALAAYAQVLREVRPSAQLDERIEAAIRDAAPPRLGVARRRGALISLAIAASTAIFAFGLMLLTRGDSSGPIAGIERGTAEEVRAQRPLPPEANPYAVMLPADYSLWPNQAEVLRVRASLGTPGAALDNAHSTGERQFWVDVRIANDGSMRIVRVVPAARTERAAE